MADTIKPFVDGCATIGFISVDLDYYHGMIQALELLNAAPNNWIEHMHIAHL